MLYHFTDDARTRATSKLRAHFDARLDGRDVRAGNLAGRFVGLDALHGQDAEEVARGAIDDFELHALDHRVGRSDRNRPISAACDRANVADHPIDLRCPGAMAGGGDGCVNVQTGVADRGAELLILAAELLKLLGKVPALALG